MNILFWKENQNVDLYVQKKNSLFISLFLFFHLGLVEREPFSTGFFVGQFERKGIRNLLMDCDAGQERGVLLRRMSHEDHVDVIEGPCLHQVNLSSNILLRRGSKNCYLGGGNNL